MGRMFSARFEAVAVAAAQDIFSLGSPTSGLGRLHAIYLGQTSDVGDAAEIIEELRIVKGNTTVGSGVLLYEPVCLYRLGTARDR